MGDLITQIQDEVDALANQFVASLYYINRHHDLKILNPKDVIWPLKKDDVNQPPPEVEPYAEDVFRKDQKELAQDLITKEQTIELLISRLPGLDRSEQSQEEDIRRLEEELKVAELQRKEALKEKEAILEKLDEVIRSVKRP